MRVCHRHSLVALLIALALTPALPAAEIHVPADHTTIQAAIDDANPGDTVIVANGVYTGEGNRNLDFGGRAITVRSANGPAGCVIDCEGNGEDYRRAFHFHSGEDAGAVVQGFTIRNGWAPAGPEWIYIAGGAIYCDGGSPTISGNVITGCKAYWVGGAIFLQNSAAVISSNTIEANVAVSGGGIACWTGSTPEISGNVITANTASEKGAGIYAEYASARPMISGNMIITNSGDGIAMIRSSLLTVAGNTIRENSGYGIRRHYSPSGWMLITGNHVAANGQGGLWLAGGDMTVTDNLITDHDSSTLETYAIYCQSLSPASTISGNVIRDNSVSLTMHVFACSPLISNNLFAGNHNTVGSGGAISFNWSSAAPLITNCTFVGNSSPFRGGALAVRDNSHPTVTNCIFRGNDAPTGKEIYVGEQSYVATLTIDHCDVEGGQSSVFVDDLGVLEWGEGMIDEDPLFVQGPWGDYYLSQTAAGQPELSPCVDAGDPASSLVAGTTRTDGEEDSGIVDMGYHYPLDSPLMVVAGPGPLYDNPPEVRIFPASDDASFVTAFPAYGAPHNGVNVACANLAGGDSMAILTGPGPGAIFGPHVRGFEGDGSPLPGLSFMAYGTNKYGVKVAAGDLDGDGDDEVITGPGPGEVFGPHVRAFDYADGAVSPLPGVSFFAYGTLKWGVNVAAGDLDGDGFDEIVTGAGPGPIFGPHVRGWNVDGGTASSIPAVSFMAYGTYRYGVRVSCGDLDGDGIAELVTAPGPSSNFATHIRGWNCDGGTVTSLAGCSFFAWGPVLPRYGAQVFAGEDLTLDGRDDMVVAPGPDPSIGSPVRVFSYTAGEVSVQFSFDAFPPGTNGGATVAAGPIWTGSGN